MWGKFSRLAIRTTGSGKALTIAVLGVKRLDKNSPLVEVSHPGRQLTALQTD